MRDVHQRAHQLGGRHAGQSAIASAEMNGQQSQRRELGREALGGRHADLGAGVRVQHQVRGARDGRIHHVADSEGARAPRFCLFDRRQGVGGLAALGNPHHQIPRSNHRLAVAELAGQVHFAGNARDVLDEELTHQARVIRSPAGQDDHAAGQRGHLLILQDSVVAVG